MCSYLFFVLAWLLAHRQPQCSADEQFSWNLLSHHLSILRSSLLRNLSAKATEYGRRWLASPHESNPIGELIRLVKLLYEKLNSACEELKNSHGYKIDDQCRQDVALSVCAMAYLLNGTATKVFKICEADMDKQRCYNETNKLIYENMWAIRFVDAFGKIPSGIFDGNLIFLGSYAECAKLDVPRWEASSQEQRNGSVGGRNCIVQLGLPPLTDQWQPSESALRRTLVTEPLFKWGICVPSTCKASDIEYLGDVAVPGLASAGMRVHCEEYSPLMDDACAIAAIMVGALLLLLVIVASVFDFSRQLQRSKTSMKAVNSRSSSPNAFSMDTMNEEQGRSKGSTMVPFTETDGRKISLLLFFSIFTNIRRLSRSDNAHLHYLDGVRCLSMMYAILGYTCMFALNNLDNALVGMDMLGELKAQLVNSAALAADTFFLLSGCLTSYWFFKRLCSDAACRFRLWVRMLGRRVIRLLPSYLAVFVCTTVLFKYFGNGPLWNGDIPSESSQEDCAVSWWTNLLLLQNFLYVRQPCFGWSWFVAAEMQCFLACFAILWFLSRRPRLGMALATLATTAFAICHLLIVVFNDYPPSYLGTTNLKELKKLEDYIRNVFIKPYAHGCSYVIGICLGYLLVKLKTKTFRMNTLPKNIIFCSAVVINAATVFSIYDYANGHPWSLVEKGIYASLSRLTWPLTVGAVIVWCRLFPKSAVSQVMSMDLWNPLAKLTYGVALIHPLIIASLLLTLRDTFHLTILNAVYNGISVTAVSYLVALVLYLCVEGPMLNIRDMYISCEGTSL